MSEEVKCRYCADWVLPKRAHGEWVNVEGAKTPIWYHRECWATFMRRVRHLRRLLGYKVSR